MYVNRFLESDDQNEYFPNALCKYTNNVIPLLTQWSYVFFALTHRYMVCMYRTDGTLIFIIFA